MSNIFIIGNGPLALQHKWGKTIDAADFVIRINDFRTVGYEEYVGRRTDLLFTCRLNEYIHTLHTFREVVLCLVMNPLDGVTIPQELFNLPNIVHRIEWPDIQDPTRVLGLRENCYPTTGMLAMLYAIARFGHVHILGFDGLGNGNRHYYEDKDRAFPSRHDGRREREHIENWEALGLLTDMGNPKYYKFDGEAPFINQNKDV